MPNEESPLAEVLNDYRQMIRIRTFEDTMLAMHREGRIGGVVHPYVGQEAVAVGVAKALDSRDHLVSTYRCHGFAIALGTNVDRLMAELMGRSTGLCRGRAGSILVADRSVGLLASIGIVASGLPIAAGAALSAQVKGTGGVAVAIIGDGAMGAGIVYETLNMAAAQRLPLVVVCENNLYQDHTRTDEVMPSASMASLAAGHQVTAVTIDGNDVATVSSAMTEAVGRARAGGGPSFVEALTFLSYFHLQFHGPPPEYRPLAEVMEWAKRDPVLRVERTLRTAGIQQDVFDGIALEAERVVRRAAEFAEASEPPSPEEAHELVVSLGQEAR
jgi:acetoin:2,6-dichlorophenolindophenol oxidoreductase subunit alpha